MNEYAGTLYTKKEPLIVCNLCYKKAFGLLLHLLYRINNAQ